jgi:hypothetical protein
MSACVPQRPRNRCPVARRTSPLLCCDGLLRASHVECAKRQRGFRERVSDQGVVVGNRSSRTVALRLLCCAVRAEKEREREREKRRGRSTPAFATAPCHAMSDALSSVPAVPPRPPYPYTHASAAPSKPPSNCHKVLISPSSMCPDRSSPYPGSPYPSYTTAWQRPRLSNSPHPIPFARSHRAAA